MKICLLNDSFPPVIDGVVNVVQNYAKYLQSEYGAEITVGCPRYPDADYSSYPYEVIAYRSYDTTAMTSGYRTGDPFSGKDVSRLAAKTPDLIHAHSPASALVVARLLREETDAPIVYTYHTKYDIDIRRAVRLETIAREGIHLMVSNIEACDEVWVVSRGAGENLKSLGFQGEYRVMNNGVDFAKGRVPDKEVEEATAGYDLPAGVPMFLFVGRMMTYKGLPMILDALKLLADSGQDFRMVFVGKGADQEMLMKKAQELGLMGDEPGRGKCIFTGPVYDRNVLRAWNTRADLFLFPSTFDTNGLVVREAAACGLASVLIRDSCAAEGITDGRNGFIIDETPEAMASLLQRVCADIGQAHQAGEHAMEEIYLSWETCVAQAHGRYVSILEAKKAGKLPQKKKVPADYLIQAAARGMAGQEKLRQRRKEMMDDLKAGAVGMMENIQDDIHEIQENTQENIQDAGEKAEQLADRMKDGLKKGTERMVQSVKETLHLDQTE